MPKQQQQQRDNPRTTEEKASFPPTEATDSEEPDPQAPTPSTTLTSISTPLNLHHDPFIYPEGGLRAWLSVFGSLCGMTCCFGLLNTIGTFQAYISMHQLKDYSSADVGWIFGLYLFVAYVSGIQTGPAFDSHGPKWLMLGGSVCLVGCMMLLSFCEKYHHFILSFSILGGLGTSLISSPAIASVGHFFRLRRGFASGIASCGGSIGGMIFPSMLSTLFPRVGFAWATRSLGFLFLFLLTIANMSIGSRLPKKNLPWRKALSPDPRIFKDTTFLLMTASLSLVECALFIPLSYLTSFALSANLSPQLSYRLLTILGAGSLFGRWLPGILADRIGRFNTLILTILLCLFATLAFWLPAALLSSSSSSTTSSPSPSNGNKPSGGAGIVETALSLTFALVFGFSSGTILSLGPVCAGQMCSTEDYGAYFATCYTVVGVGALVSVPVAGAILKAGGGGGGGGGGEQGSNYIGLVASTAASYIVGLAFLVCARVREVGWGVGGKERRY